MLCYTLLYAAHYLVLQYTLLHAALHCFTRSLLCLISGCRSGAIHNHDVRIQRHHVASLRSHTQEVCGLQWSPSGRYLASGGNDNILNIWDAVTTGEPTPLHSFSQHQAAVKVRMLVFAMLFHCSCSVGASPKSG